MTFPFPRQQQISRIPNFKVQRKGVFVDEYLGISTDSRKRIERKVRVEEWQEQNRNRQEIPRNINDVSTLQMSAYIQ
jgi:hypothetical protein